MSEWTAAHQRIAEAIDPGYGRATEAEERRLLDLRMERLKRTDPARYEALHRQAVAKVNRERQIEIGREMRELGAVFDQSRRNAAIRERVAKARKDERARRDPWNWGRARLFARED
jgi:hypothetical protein